MRQACELDWFDDFEWQTDDPASKNLLPIFKFLPVMIGYFALSGSIRIVNLLVGNLV